MLPRWVRSLDDYWSWFAEQLDYSGGRLEDESVQVQVVEDAATGERFALILGRKRVILHGGRSPQRLAAGHRAAFVTAAILTALGTLSATQLRSEDALRSTA